MESTKKPTEQDVLDKVTVRLIHEHEKPLLPKDATVKLDNTGAIQWVRLSTTIPTEGNNLSTTRAISDFESCALADVSEKPIALPVSSSTAEPMPPATSDG